MLGTNSKGQFVSISDYDAQTGARTLEPITDSAMESVVLSSERALAESENRRAYARGLEKTKKEMQSQRAIQRQKSLQKEIDAYNKKVMLYQRAALMNERMKRVDDELSVENAILDFQRQPYNKSVMEDSGFTTIAAKGRAHLAPITDYEKVLQSAGDTRHDMVTMPYNPLGGADFSQDEILNQRKLRQHWGVAAKNAGDQTTELQDSTDFDSGYIYSGDYFGKNQTLEGLGSTRNQNGNMGFDFNSLWESAQDSLQENAEKALDKAIDSAINPNAGGGGQAAPTQTTVYVPGTSVSSMNMAISPQMQKYMLYGAIGLGAIAVLGIVARIAIPSK